MEDKAIKATGRDLSGRYERLYVMLLDAIPSSVLLIDQNMCIVSANRNFLEKGRRTLANTIGYRLEEVFPTVILDQMDITKRIHQVIESNQPAKGERMTYRAPGVPIRIYYYSILPYLNDAVPTITCSRSALGALKFWWQMTRNGEREYAKQAEYILKTAQYQKDKLDEMNYPAWLNPMSNTVFFKRPGDWIMKKWDLAPDHDSRLCGDLAHEILMQHESRKTVDEFIADLKKDVSNRGING
jgi:hypothetical protein